MFLLSLPAHLSTLRFWIWVVAGAVFLLLAHL